MKIIQFLSFRIIVIIGAMWREFTIHPLLLATVSDSGKEFSVSFFFLLFLTLLPVSVSKSSHLEGLNKIRFYFGIVEGL